MPVLFFSKICTQLKKQRGWNGEEDGGNNPDEGFPDKQDDDLVI